jgi:hypothetical protein
MYNKCARFVSLIPTKNETPELMDIRVYFVIKN